MAMADVVGAAIEVNVDQAAAVHVIEEVVLPPVDHQVDADILPELGLARVPEVLGLLDELLLGGALLGLGHRRHLSRIWSSRPRPSRRSRRNRPALPAWRGRFHDAIPSRRAAAFAAAG